MTDVDASGVADSRGDEMQSRTGRSGVEPAGAVVPAVDASFGAAPVVDVT
jgi:hypothetical protein